MIRCVLDEHGCIDLLAVMRIMNQVDQEQVWAIAYELAAQMQRLWPAGNCALIESLAQIYIHRDGFIHEKSLLRLLSPTSSINEDSSEQQQGQDSSDSGGTTSEPIRAAPQPQLETTRATTAAHQDDRVIPPREQLEYVDDSNLMQASTNSEPKSSQLPPSPPITPELTSRRAVPSESELVSSLGIALFQILDYGIPDDEERKLSMTMEYLIFKSQGELTLDEILEICIKRLDVPSKTNADLHYRGICKSLVDDTIELSIFLEKIYTATMELSNGSITTTGQNSAGTTAVTTSTTNRSDLMNNCCLVAAAAAANRHNKSLSDTHGKQLASCDLNLLGQHHHHIDYHHLTSHVVNRADLSELELPLASLRALKIDDWARLWMQVIKEMRQRSEFKHLGMSATAGHELGCSNL